MAMSIPDDATASHARRARGENVGWSRNTQRAARSTGICDTAAAPNASSTAATVSRWFASVRALSYTMIVAAATATRSIITWRRQRVPSEPSAIRNTAEINSAPATAAA